MLFYLLISFASRTRFIEKSVQYEQYFIESMCVVNSIYGPKDIFRQPRCIR